MAGGLLRQWNRERSLLIARAKGALLLVSLGDLNLCQLEESPLVGFNFMNAKLAQRFALSVRRRVLSVASWGSSACCVWCRGSLAGWGRCSTSFMTKVVVGSCVAPRCAHPVGLCAGYVRELEQGEDATQPSSDDAFRLAARVAGLPALDCPGAVSGPAGSSMVCETRVGFWCKPGGSP